MQAQNFSQQEPVDMSITEREARTFFHTYKRLPLDIERGEGMYLYTRDGRKLLDMVGGIAVNSLGYAHPSILRAITEQAGKYLHISNYFLQEPQIALAEKLLHITGYDRLFFTNSGTETTEGAMKLARKWGNEQGKHELVAFTGAFHGRTMGALSLMNREKYREGFEPLLANCTVVDFNDVPALEATINESTAAVFLEFIQGEGGIRPVSGECVAALSRLRDTFDFLIIADEVQAGIGRTGRFFGFEHFDIRPDVVTVAKPLGGGLPLGAILGNERVREVLTPGSHGTTFGGNPVACAAGLAVLEEIIDHGLMKRAANTGELLVSSLNAIAQEFPSLIQEVRGFGLMVGVEFTRPVDQIVDAMRDRNVLVNGTAGNVLRLLPPLIIRPEQIEEFTTALRDTLKDLS
jgi:acetylornithine aminotransferase